MNDSNLEQPGPRRKLETAITRLDHCQRSWLCGQTRARHLLRQLFTEVMDQPVVDPTVGRLLIPRLQAAGMIDQALALEERLMPLADRPAEVPEALGDCYASRDNLSEAALRYCQALLEEPSPERFSKFYHSCGMEPNPAVENAFQAFAVGDFATAETKFLEATTEFSDVPALAAALERTRDRITVRDCFCSRPFTDIHVNRLGNTTPCCPGWLPVNLGFVGRQSLQEVWNGSIAREVRETILDSSFRYCVRSRCPLLSKPDTIRRDKVKDPELRAFMDAGETRLQQGPHRVALNYDKSCNLACPSCRPDFIQLKGKELEQAERIQEQVLDQWLDDTRLLKLNNAGDIFGSPLGRQLLHDLQERNPENLWFGLITNAMVLTPNQWEKFPILHGRVNVLEISVDAATPETYAVVRRSGQLPRLLENLRFLAEKTRENQIRLFRLSFVVQNRNFREMPDFVRLGLDLGVDEIVFKKFVARSWLKKDMDLYRSDFGVHDPQNPEHEEFLKVLQDPILKHEKVSWHSLNAFFEEVTGKDLFTDSPDSTAPPSREESCRHSLGNRNSRTGGRDEDEVERVSDRTEILAG